MTSMPDKFLRRVFRDLPPLRQYAVGNIFFTKNSGERNDIYDAKRIFEQFAERIEGIKVQEWRVVPVNNSELGASAKAFEPHIEQVLIVAHDECAQDEQKFECALYRLRMTAAHAINERLRK